MKSRIIAGAAIALFVVSMMVPGLAAQTFTSLFNFDSTDGANPHVALVQGTDGNFYGTTGVGGANKNCDGTCGTVFKMTPSGVVTTLYDFCSQSNCTDGANPDAALVQATDGNFYGTTLFGGANDRGVCKKEGCGTVFSISPSGTLKTIYSFCSRSDCADGLAPAAALIQATDGNFYGTTFNGGANGAGTVYKITPGGNLKTLYSFCSESLCTDGSDPYASLVQGADGNFYGTTTFGGANDAGTVFKITLSGMLTTLYSFCSQTNCTDGAEPFAALVQADGNFYGAAYQGGVNDNNSCPYGCGTIFSITPNGELTTLYSFCSQTNCTDGEIPFAALIQATDGNLYGMTGFGGTHDCPGETYGCGTLFKVTLNGRLETLYNFCAQTGCTDGAEPPAGVVQDTDGSFYGTTSGGGTSSACAGGCGTVFSLSVGLGPFVETNPASGKVGASVKILGTNLTGATSVSFNGRVAAFTVKSGSLITTTVPAGATTGFVTVTTPSKTLKSNVPFRVLP